MPDVQSRPVIRPRLARTANAIRFTLSRGDALAVTSGVALLYLLAYLWMTDLLQFRTGAGISWMGVDDPWARLFDQRATFSFEPIGILEFGVGTMLVSPVDMALGGTLGVLVGLNMGVAYLALVQPRACGLGAGAGFAAAVPALFSGSVCCAPVLILVLGIQASGTLLTVLPWLLPVGVAMLLGSLVYVAGMIDVGHSSHTN